jgi:hypothetical protein
LREAIAIGAQLIGETRRQGRDAKAATLLDAGAGEGKPALFLEALDLQDQRRRAIRIFERALGEALEVRAMGRIADQRECGERGTKRQPVWKLR